jgi:hypothetical protein
MNDQRVTKLQQTSDTIFTSRAYAESAVQEIDYSGMLLFNDDLQTRELLAQMLNFLAAAPPEVTDEMKMDIFFEQLKSRVDRPMKLTAETKAAKKLKTAKS